MNMISCPSCHKSIEQNALSCSYCQKKLNAFGHPGIPLHQAPQNHYLCEQCTYHYDDTCTYPQHPYAKSCTLYHDYKTPLVGEITSSTVKRNSLQKFHIWCGQHRRLLIFLSLIIISFTLTLMKMK